MLPFCFGNAFEFFIVLRSESSVLNRTLGLDGSWLTLALMAVAVIPGLVLTHPAVGLAGGAVCALLLGLHQQRPIANGYLRQRRSNVQEAMPELRVVAVPDVVGKLHIAGVRAKAVIRRSQQPGLYVDQSKRPAAPQCLRLARDDRGSHHGRHR